MTTDNELDKIRKKRAQELLEIANLRKQRMEELKQSKQAPASVEEKDKLALIKFFLV